EVQTCWSSQSIALALDDATCMNALPGLHFWLGTGLQVVRRRRRTEAYLWRGTQSWVMSSA
ncbi:hypothetical protein, partial [Corynebacterium sp. HMSC068G04]|uniref:hypothetical protein n=1 Tax=Corynebacterium sp. HMSC068G04 TaxID=1739497 RepID=UPI001AF0127D